MPTSETGPVGGGGVSGLSDDSNESCSDLESVIESEQGANA